MGNDAIRGAIEHENNDTLRKALLAVIDATEPDTLPPNGCDCPGCLREWIRHQTGVALGITAD